MRRTATPTIFHTNTYEISGHWRMHEGDIIEFTSASGRIQGVFVLKKCAKDTSPCDKCCIPRHSISCPRVQTATSIRRLCDKVSNGYLESVCDMMEEL